MMIAWWDCQSGAVAAVGRAARAARRVSAAMTRRPSGQEDLVRADAAGCAHELLDWITAQRLSYSVGFTLPATITDERASPSTTGRSPTTPTAIPVPARGVLEVTGMLDLSRWPPGMRVIVRRERPHLGTQLRIPTPTGTATPRSRRTPGPAGRAVSLPTSNSGTAAGPASRTASDYAKDTGLTNLPLHGLAQNLIWCAFVSLACELTAWEQQLELAEHPARRWEPSVSGCGSSPSPVASPAPDAAPCCTCPQTSRGPRRCSRPSPPCRAHRTRLSSRTSCPTTVSRTGPWNRAYPTDLGCIVVHTVKNQPYGRTSPPASQSTSTTSSADSTRPASASSSAPSAMPTASVPLIMAAPDDMTCVTSKHENRHTARHHQRETPALERARQNRHTDSLNLFRAPSRTGGDTVT